TLRRPPPPTAALYTLSLHDALPISGAAYVFSRTGATWSQEAYLKASNTDPGDVFGISVGISGDTVAVGAYFEASAASGINGDGRSEEHTSELQSRGHLVCRLLLEKK